MFCCAHLQKKEEHARSTVGTKDLFHVLTLGFSPLEILRVKSQHTLFRLAFRDFPRVLALV
jgi:hypothetical protein